VGIDLIPGHLFGVTGFVPTKVDLGDIGVALEVVQGVALEVVQGVFQKEVFQGVKVQEEFVQGVVVQEKVVHDHGKAVQDQGMAVQEHGMAVQEVVHRYNPDIYD